MQQQISFVTLGIAELDRSRRFYVEGFGWSPVFENEEIIFYQMAGFVLGTFLKHALEEDMNRTGLATPGAFSLAHNVLDKDSVEVVMQKLVAARRNCPQTGRCSEARRVPGLRCRSGRSRLGDRLDAGRENR